MVQNAGAGFVFGDRHGFSAHFREPIVLPLDRDLQAPFTLDPSAVASKAHLAKFAQLGKNYRVIEEKEPAFVANLTTAVARYTDWGSTSTVFETARGKSIQVAAREVAVSPDSKYLAWRDDETVTIAKMSDLTECQSIPSDSNERHFTSMMAMNLRWLTPQHVGWFVEAGWVSNPRPSGLVIAHVSNGGDRLDSFPPTHQVNT